MVDFKKTPEVKVLRDPVHGYIHVDLEVVWNVINSAWFQRLRRIRQLGGANMVYHCAEHTRFGHSLGVYEIVRRMVTEISDIKESLSDYEKVCVMLAGLLHDIGHGPFSHTFEAITTTSHEDFSCRIIEENTEITKILESEKAGLAKDVADIIRHEAKNPLLSQIISSQLDADRMDYLLRDAYFTGTAYGQFDLERILRTIRTHNGNRLVVKQSGVYAVENYIMSRYHMYWQVYYHPVARSYENIMHCMFQRLLDIKDAKAFSLFEPLVERKEITLEEYFEMDDYSFSFGFNHLCNHEDKILNDLAKRLRDRELFEYADNTLENTERYRNKLEELGFDIHYYLATDKVRQTPYIPYTKDAESMIWIRMKDGSTEELSNASNIVYSLTHGPSQDDNKVFFPKEAL